MISRSIWPQTLINYFHSGALKKQEKSGALQPRFRILGCVWTKLNIIITSAQLVSFRWLFTCQCDPATPQFVDIAIRQLLLKWGP